MELKRNKYSEIQSKIQKVKSEIFNRNNRSAATASQILQDDPITETSYTNPKVNYDPKTTTDNLNFTSTRVAKNVYNQYYKDSGKPEVFGYYTDWSQYDGRLSDGSNPATNDPYDWSYGFGRGRDLGALDPLAYDRIILGFVGIVGDKGPKSGVVSTAATQLDKTEDEVTFIDPWGDISTWRNCGFTQSEWQNAQGWDIGGAVPYKNVMNQTSIEQGKAFGVLGGLWKKQQEAKRLGRTLNLAFSIGGWTLSGPFYELVKTPSRRTKFVDSICKIFDAFPMFTHVDVDWEYPGTQGLETNPPFDQVNDGPNYVLLMDEMRKKFDARYTGSNKKHISIACAAPIDKMQHSKIPELINVGLDGINIMSYDFFGTPWAENIAHHANLHPYDNPTNWSASSAVEYLLSQGVSSKNINVGWGAYSRNGQNAAVASLSPLKGDYTPEGNMCLGTFESGTSEFYDITKNYIDLENRTGRNGYQLYTDSLANADYLYNPSNGMFISFETPRAVFAKGRYTAEKSLGGMFVWTIDIENGLLANAAHEGCGHYVDKQAINMNQFYFCGSNISSSECQLITGGNNSPSNRPPVVTIIPSSVEANEQEIITLNATVIDPEGSTNLKSGWISIHSDFIIISESNTSLQLLTPNVTKNTEYVVVFEADDGENIVTKNVPILVRDKVEGNPGGCVDPAATNYAPWNASSTYNTPDRVSYNNLVWEAKWWTSGNIPGQSEQWLLRSNVVADWNPNVQYQANSVVNHLNRMWKSTGWMDSGIEPGAPGQPSWAEWKDIGAASCTPPSRHGTK